MTVRQIHSIVVLCVLFLLACIGDTRADEKKKEPTEPPRPDKLKRFIQVQVDFTSKGLRIVAVKRDGPAARAKSPDGKTTASLRRGDMIEEVEGAKVKSEADYVKALNGAADPNSIHLKVRDRATGQVNEWVVGSADSPFAQWRPAGPPKQKKDTKKTEKDDD